MNIQSKVDKKEEKVLVSDENGTLKIIDYQDNIIEILKSEDIIEDLEKLLIALKKENDETVTELQKNVLNKTISDLAYLLLFGLEGGIISLLMNSNLDFPFIIEKINKMIDNLKDILTTKGFFIGEMIGFIVFLLLRIIYILIKKGNPTEERKKLQRHYKGLDYEIHCLQYLLFKLKLRKELLLLKKEKKNIENVSTEIKEINYREELELYKNYLNEMYNQGYSNAFVKKKSDCH